MKSKCFIGIALLLLTVGVMGCHYNLRVENRTSQTLDIYVDNFYEGSVAGGNSLLIRDLPHGDRLVEAINMDGRIVADSIIYLDDDTAWVIHGSYQRHR